ncbi:hypothetical protein [Acidovorax sp. sic0104]|uniref:hypothetical protein n=1 Tax=Acidovorax sp. sic0104 TaxID=2854784 RepID=UPI001C455B29|nr:hypothetical protein [Acidovorax sp. sic0104]MBV7541027.1 hypothetical protein [Acidovorax sp. sic0104]
MQHIKYTYVDAATGVPVTDAPASSGPVNPAVEGLQFVWVRESQYPTHVPEFFGTCPDESDTDVPGVLAVISQEEFDALQAVELEARSPVPRTVSRAQGKAALIQSDLWDDVLAFVAGIDDPKERAIAEVALNDTTEWQRSSPFLNAAAAHLGMDKDALDALFVLAGEIQL